MDFLNKEFCRYHPDAILIEDCHAGDIICPECGLVVGDRVIDVGREWRTFGKTHSNGVDPNRCGGPTTIIGSDTDPATKKRNRQRIRSSDRNFVATFKEISAMASRINLPEVIVDRAHNVCRQLRSCIRLRSRSIGAKASACLYIACRQEGAPRSLMEICAISTVSKRDIGRCFKLVLRELPVQVGNISSTDFMSRFCANLELPKKIQVVATYIAKKAADLDNISGRSPTSVAAAAIYLALQASECMKTDKDIGEIAGVAPKTINQIYKLLLPHVAYLFPENFDFETPIEYQM